MIATARAATPAPLRALWRRYLRLRRPIRWPLTAVALVLLAVILSNLVFGGGAQSTSREFRIPPGEARTMSVDVGPGRNVTVAIRPLVGLLRPAPLAEAVIRGPTGVADATGLQARATLRFKGGFSPALYTLTLTNISPSETGRWVVEWTIR